MLKTKAINTKTKSFSNYFIIISILELILQRLVISAASVCYAKC